MGKQLFALGLLLVTSVLVISGCEIVQPTETPTPGVYVETPTSVTLLPPTTVPTRTPTQTPGSIQEQASPTPPAWGTYTNDAYLFAFSYPSGWMLEEIPAGQDVPGGKSAHAIHLTQGGHRLVIQYKSVMETTVIGHGGLPAGEVVDGGTVTFLGQELTRRVLVFEGKDKSVFYSGQFDDLEFHIQLDDDPGAGVEYQAIEIPEAVQAEVDEIIGTLARTGEPAHAAQELLTFENEEYGFSFQYPASWALEEAPHAVTLTQGTRALVIEFRRATEDVRIGPSGAPAGEFVDRGTVSILERTFDRRVLVFEGRDRGVYYNGTSVIQAGDVEFVLILSENSADGRAILPDVTQAEADQIVQSLVSTAVPEPSLGTDCIDYATFVNDVTIPDDTVLAAGEAFVKTWRLNNSGTCTWGPGYAVVCVSGDCMGASASVALIGDVLPGDMVDVSVDLVAPEAAGSYAGNWQLQNPDGARFGLGGSPGDPFWLKIVVGTPARDLANYANNAYRFAFQVPPTWNIQEDAHAVKLSQGALDLIIEYKWDTEDVHIGPTGLPAGEFVERGTVNILAQTIPRSVLVYQGHDKGVYYGGAPAEIRARDLVFVIILSHHATDPDFSIPKDVQSEADLIVQSLMLIQAPP